MKAWMMDYAYWVTLGAVIAVVAASAIYTREFRARQEALVQAAAQAAELEETPAPTTAPQVTPLPTIAPLQVHYAPMKSATVWPVAGEVLRTHDGEQLVYWEAVGCWRVHEGLDIAGEAGQSVAAAADGVVSATVRDELWGWRVTIEQTDGRQAIYAGLETAGVTAGQSVTRGQEIGTLLRRIPCEAEMDAHLHMELRREGKAQDPEGMLPER